MNKATPLALALVGALTYSIPVFAGSTQDKTQDVLSEIHQANQEEIQMGKMAQEKGNSPSVKTFGEKLVKDHTAADEKVQSLAQKENITLKAESDLKKTMNDHTMKSLAEKNGSEFDQAFAKEMVGDHDKTIAKLEKAQKELATTPTGSLIAELLPTLRQHLDQAKQLEAQKS